MTLDEFKRLIESDFGPTDAGLLGELVAIVENMVAGGSELMSAIYNAAQEMRDTLAEIQRLGDDDLGDDLTDEFDAALAAALDTEDGEGDDMCDNCYTSGVAVSQTCPICGRTLCADCAAENDGRCGECVTKTDDDSDGHKECADMTEEVIYD